MNRLCYESGFIQACWGKDISDSIYSELRTLQRLIIFLRQISNSFLSGHIKEDAKNISIICSNIPLPAIWEFERFEGKDKTTDQLAHLQLIGQYLITHRERGVIKGILWALVQENIISRENFRYLLNELRTSSSLQLNDRLRFAKMSHQDFYNYMDSDKYDLLDEWVESLLYSYIRNTLNKSQINYLGLTPWMAFRENNNVPGRDQATEIGVPFNFTRDKMLLSAISFDYFLQWVALIATLISANLLDDRNIASLLSWIKEDNLINERKYQRVIEMLLGLSTQDARLGNKLKDALSFLDRNQLRLNVVTSKTDSSDWYLFPHLKRKEKEAIPNGHLALSVPGKAYLQYFLNILTVTISDFIGNSNDWRASAKDIRGLINTAYALRDTIEDTSQEIFIDYQDVKPIFRAVSRMVTTNTPPEWLGIPSNIEKFVLISAAQEMLAVMDDSQTNQHRQWVHQVRLS